MKVILTGLWRWFMATICALGLLSFTISLLKPETTGVEGIIYGIGIVFEGFLIGMFARDMGRS